MSTDIHPGVVPPPPGVQPNFVDPPTQTNDTIVLHTICLTFATLLVGMRIYTRQFISCQLGWDDYCCVLSYALTIIFSALMIEADARGLGRHLWDIPILQLPSILKIFTIAQYAYLLLAPSIKLSCLLFYRRVFSPSRKTMWFITAGIAFIVAAHISLFFATIFQCTPVEKSWNQATPGQCIDPKPLPYASGVINVLGDLYVLILPIPCIWGLNLRMGRKLRTLAIFSMGILACAASIIRLAMTPTIFTDMDTTWNLSQIGIWAVIEVNVGIMCACSLALPAFIERHGLSGFGSYVTRVISHPSSRQGEKSSRTHSTRGIFQSHQGSDRNRTDDLKPNRHEHSELHANEMQYIVRRTTTDHQYAPSSNAKSSQEDIEAWPGDSQGLSSNH